LQRLRLTYDVPETGALRSIVARIGTMRYASEVGLYQQVAPRIALRTPYCYFAATDPDADRYVRLLEDLAPAGAAKLNRWPATFFMRFQRCHRQEAL
jgi:hypothetical protein